MVMVCHKEYLTQQCQLPLSCNHMTARMNYDGPNGMTQFSGNQLKLLSTLINDHRERIGNLHLTIVNRVVCKKYAPEPTKVNITVPS